MESLNNISHIPELINIVQDYLWGDHLVWKQKWTSDILSQITTPKDTILLNMIPINNRKYINMEYEWVDRLPFLIDDATQTDNPTQVYNLINNPINDLIEEYDDDNMYEMLGLLFLYSTM